jgi:penicillin-binding protein 1A
MHPGVFSGDVLVRRAIARSINVIAVLAYESIGGELIAEEAAKMMGISKDRFEIDPTLALGSSEVTPLELTTGFACFVNQGEYVDPHFIEKIVDSEGEIVYQYKKKSKQAISSSTAFIMTSILQDVVNNGTATSAIRRQVGFMISLAVKQEQILIIVTPGLPVLHLI